MFNGALSAIIVLLALVAIYYGVRIMGRRSWIIGWLRGTAGIAFLALAVCLIMVALDLTSYQRLLEDTPIATISMQEIGPKHYNAKVSYILEGSESEYELKGDQWQLDARVIRWKGLLAKIGTDPCFRFDRISGRYYSLEEERRSERTVYNLENSDYGLDFWAFVKKANNKVPWVDAVYGSATYLPMADGAMFEVSLSKNGLVAKPINAIAKQAVVRWQ